MLESSTLDTFEFSEATQATLKRIRNELEMTVSKYQNLEESSLSESALVSLKSLKKAVNFLRSKLTTISKNSLLPESLEENQKNLEILNSELQDLISQVRSLKTNAESLKEISSCLTKDAGPQERVQILDVSTMNGVTWTIKVKYHERCSGNLRNIGIYDVSENYLLCSILLMEPGDVVSVMTNSEVKLARCVVVKVEDRVISEQFFVNFFKILKVIVGEQIEIVIKSFLSSNVIDLKLWNGNNYVVQGLSFAPLGLEVIKIQELDSCDLCLVFNQNICSNLYKFVKNN